MKRKIFTFMGILFFSGMSYAGIVITIQTKPNDPCPSNEYGSTRTERNEGGGDISVLINCWCELGDCGCPSSIAPGGPGQDGTLDPTDFSSASTLMGLVDADIVLGYTSGSKTLNVQVTGESFIRHYAASWNVVSGNYVITTTRDDY